MCNVPDPQQNTGSAPHATRPTRAGPDEQSLRDRLTARIDALSRRKASAEAAVSDARKDCALDVADLGSTRAAVADERGVAEVAGRRLAETEAALQRLEDGTFGICTACGSPVDQERMLAVPQTELCVTCRRDAGSRRGTRTEGRE